MKLNTNPSRLFRFSKPMKLRNLNLPILCSAYTDVIFLFSLSLLCLQPKTAIATPNNETDRLALFKFKESIDRDPYNLFKSWNDSIHFCNWQGVTCGRRHQRLTALDLRGYALGGSISPYIGNLSFLRSLDLEDNFLRGEIPKEVTRLFRLRFLALTNNSLIGELPSNWSNCPEVGTLDFLRNKLSGNIPAELGSLRKMFALGVARNKLTGSIPPSLGNASSIIILSLTYNQLVGDIPEEIGRLQRLALFEVSVNDLSGTIPYSLYNISTIAIFSATGNHLHGTLPANIGLFAPHLRFFSISTNKFSGQIPSSLTNASALEVLHLSANNFVGQVPRDLGSLANLRKLVISFNNLGSNSAFDLDFLISLRNCTQLSTLDFGRNKFGGSLPNSIGNLSRQLSQLFLGDNHISGIIPAALENLINLTTLGMEQNQFSGSIPTFFGKFQKLQGFFLYENRLSGHIPSSIGNLTQLVDLLLSYNKLEGGIPSSFGNCRSLQMLDIAENILSGAIPENSLSSQLLVLNLSQNSLFGTLPVEIGNLKNIFALDVSENNFSGEIPISIGNCLSLEDLYLQGNSFQGTLPPPLASLRGLQFLDLSRNNLSGLIPKDLRKLSFLLYLNLSFNELEGEVPTEGVFRSASTIIVTGNTKLCGGIPALQLQACDIKVKKPRISKAFKVTMIVVSSGLCFFLFSSFLVIYRRSKSEKKSCTAVSTTNLLPNVSYKEVYQATGGFSPSNLLGSGSFGSVYKGILDEEGKIVAVKVLNLLQKGASSSFLAECNVLRNTRHRNLVKIITCCSSIDYNGNEFKALVFEFLANGSLEKWLHPDIDDNEHQSRNLNLVQRLNIAVDVVSALHYLHEQGGTPIVHRDLKPGNVLLDVDMVAHVTDFGLSKLLSTTNDVSQSPTSTPGIKGSIGYAAPEYGMGNEASTEGDVYSFGIFLLEMFTGKRPTDKMFEDGLTLHKFVKMALPGRLVQILEPRLQKSEVNEIPPGTEEDQNYHNSGRNVIEVEEESNHIENLSQMSTNVKKCLLSVFEVGLACSLESPKERMKMSDITRELYRIRNAFLGGEVIE